MTATLSTTLYSSLHRCCPLCDGPASWGPPLRMDRVPRRWAVRGWGSCGCGRFRVGRRVKGTKGRRFALLLVPDGCPERIMGDPGEPGLMAPSLTLCPPGADPFDVSMGRAVRPEALAFVWRDFVKRARVAEVMSS